MVEELGVEFSKKQQNKHESFTIKGKTARYQSSSVTFQSIELVFGAGVSSKNTTAICVSAFVPTADEMICSSSMSGTNHTVEAEASLIYKFHIIYVPETLELASLQL